MLRLSLQAGLQRLVAAWKATQPEKAPEAPKLFYSLDGNKWHPISEYRLDRTTPGQILVVLPKFARFVKYES